MDAEELHRAVMGLKPCVVFHDIGPEMLTAIRAAAQPQPPAARIDVHPYYLDRFDGAAAEASHVARQQLQDYLDDAMREHVLARMRLFEENARSVWRADDL
jgi:hypothetical protein